jgi:hypothetical protein
MRAEAPRRFSLLEAMILVAAFGGWLAATRYFVSVWDAAWAGSGKSICSG